MLVGLFGGTFDPVHKGHLHVAQTIFEHTPIQRVHMILSARPGHRGEPTASVEDRWQMLKLACQHVRNTEAVSGELVADDSELNRQGPSYTVDTLLALREQHSDWLPCWVLGWDSFITLPQWHRWQEILSLCNLLVVTRPSGQEFPAEIAELCHSHETKSLSTTHVGQIFKLTQPMLDISATLVRETVRLGLATDDLLVDPVSTYIRQHDLYLNSLNPLST